MIYRVQFHSHGIMRCEFHVPAVEKGIVGDYARSRNYGPAKPFGPCPDSIIESLPYRFRAAFWRGANGWHAESPFPHWRIDLARKRDGAAIGTVFATLERGQA